MTYLLFKYQEKFSLVACRILKAFSVADDKRYLYHLPVSFDLFKIFILIGPRGNIKFRKGFFRIHILKTVPLTFCKRFKDCNWVSLNTHEYI